MSRKTYVNKKIEQVVYLSVAPSVDKSQHNEMSQMIDHWLMAGKSEGHSPRTQSHNREHIEKFLWWWNHHSRLAEKVGAHPRNATSYHMREFIAYMREELAFRWGKPVIPGKEKLSPTTVRTYGQCTRTFFNWLEDEGLIEHSPFTRRVKLTSKKDPIRTQHHKNISEEQQNKIFSMLNRPERLKKYNGVRDLAIVALLLDSGIRRGELLSMRVKDLDMEKRRVEVNGKSGPRTAFFSPKAYHALVNYKKLWRNQQDQSPTAMFWLCSDGFPLSAMGLKSMIRTLGDSAGFRFGAHQLRHTFGSHMVDKVGIFELKEMLGHSNVATTQIYAHGSADKLQDKYRGNSPLADLNVTTGQGVKRRRGRPKKGEEVEEEGQEIG